jgi:hypothetical protein
MSESKKYEFQYQHFNNSSNSQPFYGILDLSQGNSIMISLKRLRKHNIANHVLTDGQGILEGNRFKKYFSR